MDLKSFAIPLALLGFSLPLIPTLANAQIDEKTFYKGPTVVVLRLTNPYLATQWKDVETYTTQGFLIVSIIPGKSLAPDPNNPGLIFVVMQKMK
jgi:hypothetical protein